MIKKLKSEQRTESPTFVFFDDMLIGVQYVIDTGNWLSVYFRRDSKKNSCEVKVWKCQFEFKINLGDNTRTPVTSLQKNKYLVLVPGKEISTQATRPATKKL